MIEKHLLFPKLQNFYEEFYKQLPYIKYIEPHITSQPHGIWLVWNSKRYFLTLDIYRDRVEWFVRDRESNINDGQTKLDLTQNWPNKFKKYLVIMFEELTPSSSVSWLEPLSAPALTWFQKLRMKLLSYARSAKNFAKGLLASF